MIRHFRSLVLGFSLAALEISFSMAQSKPAPAPAAPIPPQILAAKKAFIANAGGDQMANNYPRFSGTPDRAYNEFYAAVKSWGRFEMAGSPAEADLLLEVRQSVSAGPGPGVGLIPQFRLKIRDARTNALLWGFTINGEFGLGQGESDRNFDQAVNRLVTELRTLVTPPAADGNGP
jgi:hypothetical protein